MIWRKQGRIFKPDGSRTWSRSHAQVPIAEAVGDERLRIYYGTRDQENRTVTTFIETAAADPREVLTVAERPVLGLGELGCFDDCGAMPSWLVHHDGRLYLYYIGWAACTSVPYRNAIGLAISEDGGRTFERYSRGPIVDRTHDEPHFCGTACVLIDAGVWRMWYLSTLRWVQVDGRPEPVYHLRYAESSDGVSWQRFPDPAVDLCSPEEGGIARASVLKRGTGYQMWYCYRGIRDYRTDPRSSYRIGYAESADGIRWQRLDDRAGIERSARGWDSEMIAYPFVYERKGHLHMLYNGNGFGRSGFGYAVSDAV